jgi:hypothetical protein
MSIILFKKNQNIFLYYLKEYDNSIIKYYNINNPNLLITFNPNQQYYEINMVYDRKQEIFHFPMLPYELNKKINDFTNSYINITLKINNVEYFPYEPPIWSLKNIEYFIPSGIHINIKEYYEYLVNLHNENNKNWVPSMRYINSDLLNFIMIANTFDYL